MGRETFAVAHTFSLSPEFILTLGRATALLLYILSAPMPRKLRRVDERDTSLIEANFDVEYNKMINIDAKRVMKRGENTRLRGEGGLRALCTDAIS